MDENHMRTLMGAVVRAAAEQTSRCGATDGWIPGTW